METTQGTYMLIKTNGEITYADSMNLKDMQNFVEGYIEMLIRDEQEFIFCEEGLLKKFKHNKIASDMAKISLVGNVIVSKHRGE